MSDTNKVSVRYGKETSYGGALVSSTITEIRTFGESLELEQNFIESDEFRTDGNIVDNQRVGLRASGGIQTRLSWATFDEWLEWLVRADSTYAGASTVTGTGISASSVDNSFNDTGNGFTTPAFDAGKIIKASQFTNGANNGHFLIVTRSSNAKIIVVGANALVTEAAGATRTVAAQDSVINGTTLPSMKIEKAFTDIAATFHDFEGETIAGMTLSVQNRQFVGMDWRFMGKSLAQNTSSMGSATTPANSNPLVQGVDGLHWFVENNAKLAVSAFTLAIENNLREREELGTLGPESIGQGDFRATGTFQAYFKAANTAVMTRYVAGTFTSIAFCLRDSSSRGYAWVMRNVRITGSRVLARAKNGDCLLEVNYQAIFDSQKAYTMRIAKLP